MRAVTESKNFSDDERGLVGIGTLIIFIALILVASVAAGVIIRTSGALREQARKTGQEAIREVSNGLRVLGTKGRVAGEENIDNIEVTVALRAGSDGINFKDLTVQYMSQQTSRHLTLGKVGDNWMAYENKDELGNDWENLDSHHFAVVKIYPEDTGEPNILGETGSKAAIWIDTDEIEMDANGGDNALTVDEEAALSLMPKVGIETDLTAMVPPALEDENVVQL